MEANHPQLTTQKSFYSDIVRARDQAEIVTADQSALKEQLEAATCERIAALEAVEPKRTKGRLVKLEAGQSAPRGRYTGIAAQGTDPGAGSGTVLRTKGARPRLRAEVPCTGLSYGETAYCGRSVYCTFGSRC